MDELAVSSCTPAVTRTILSFLLFKIVSLCGLSDVIHHVH